MMKTLLKFTSMVFMILGLINTIMGKPEGLLYLVAGSIMDLQATAMDNNERLNALENKGKKVDDAT